MNLSSTLPLDHESLADQFNFTANTTNYTQGDNLTYWEDALSDSRYIVQSILVPIVMIIGAFGNGITIAIMTRRHMQTSTNFYLTALALSDILYLLFTFSLSLMYAPGMSHADHWLYWEYYRYGLWLTDASSNTSIWLTVTFTIERYIAVCHPMKGKVFCTQSRAKRIIIAVYLLCFILTITTPHEWIVVPDPERNGTHLMLDSSELGKHETYRKSFYWFTAVTFIVLPLILLAAFNTFLILAVKRSRKQRTVMASTHRDPSTHSTQENKITIMLIAVVLLALVCQLPTAAMLIYTSFHHHEDDTVEFYVIRILNNFFNLLTAVNAAVNFVFYCALSDRYRRTFLQTFCRRWYQRHSPTPSWMATTGYSNFEDGSPRASFRSSIRGSSIRASRRSSYRSSPSTTPRASPSRSVRGVERRNTGSFLRVPPRSFTSLPLQEETQAEIALNHSSEVSKSPSSNQSYILKHTFHNGDARRNSKGIQDSVDNEGHSSSEALLNDNLLIPAEAEIVPQAITNSDIETKEKFPFFRWFRSLKQPKKTNNSEYVPAKRHSIIITCQKPSFEEQTAV